MLYKEDKYDDNSSYTQWRYWCDCRSPDHVLGFDEWIDQDPSLQIYICSNPEMTRWDRIKNAFKLLFGKEAVYLEVVISSEDREELAKAIKGE